MAVRISKGEQRRAEARGLLKFLEAEQRRLEDDVYDEEDQEHVRRKIEEYRERIEEIEDEVDGDTETVLDSEREISVESGDFETEEEREDWRSFADFHGNMAARVECQVVEDLASAGGITKQDIGEMLEEYDELKEELWKTFGV